MAATLRLVTGIRFHRLIAVASLAMGNRAAAQPSVPPTLRATTVTVDTLLRTIGLPWSSGQSRHFVVHLERPKAPNALTTMLDSLEAAWVGAVTLLNERVPDEPRVHVFITESRTRFAGLVPPASKGLTTLLHPDGHVIILVQNDSVRAYMRHEVMHLVSWRAWGLPGTSRAWLAEGLATFADGRCQESTIITVGRDLLAARPGLRVDNVVSNFIPMWRAERTTAYVMAGTLVDYLWASRGRASVRRLWAGSDSLVDISVLPGAGGELTAAWRAYVAGKAAVTRGVATSAFLRAGCG